jgi:hypothetical protein
MAVDWRSINGVTFRGMRSGGNTSNSDRDTNSDPDAYPANPDPSLGRGVKMMGRRY